MSRFASPALWAATKALLRQSKTTNNFAFGALKNTNINTNINISTKKATSLQSGGLWRCFSSMMNLEVPQMGDSITEGSIASVLKSVGESVAEDEVVVQIETDKVTIDVRSPAQGVLNAVLVKEDDTVVVGQHIATIEEGAEGSVSTTTTTTTTSASASTTSSSGADSEEEEETSATGTEDEEPVESRVASIQFPTRRTQDGKIISQLSMEERVNLGLMHEHHLHGEAGGSSSPLRQQSKQKTAIPMFTDLHGDPSWTNYKPNYEDHIKRRVISEREIESIMLGGASD